MDFNSSFLLMEPLVWILLLSNGFYISYISFLLIKLVFLFLSQVETPSMNMTVGGPFCKIVYHELYLKKLIIGALLKSHILASKFPSVEVS
ncbi:hypothetical protein ACP275_10G017300 [Erythranthe tilingii]